MLIAREKRRENIAEYILYLWQLEDLLRALEFSPERIYKELVLNYSQLDTEAQKELFEWYVGMGELLKSEGKEEQGHMQHTMHLIGDLEDLHEHLLSAPIGKQYRELFAKLKSELSALGEGGDIERCFKALYSVILCRMKGVENEAYISDVLELISPVIAQLTHIYHKIERGEIDPYEDVNSSSKNK